MAILILDGFSSISSVKLVPCNDLESAVFSKLKVVEMINYGNR